MTAEAVISYDRLGFLLVLCGRLLEIGHKLPHSNTSGVNVPITSPEARLTLVINKKINQILVLYIVKINNQR